MPGWSLTTLPCTSTQACASSRSPSLCTPKHISASKPLLRSSRHATSERGRIYVFAAADSFQLLARNELSARCLATPAIADGELFIRTEGHLYCFPPKETAPEELAASP